jgi:hypothetical protein
MDSYAAGQLTNDSADVIRNAWIYIIRDIAILAICLTLLFAQLFRNQLIIMRRSW